MICNPDTQGLVDEIAQRITDGKQQATSFMEDALDIQYIINQDKTYRGARILVAFGGPNIWVNTQQGVVEGYWWGDDATAGFIDNMGLDDYLEEMYAH
tara:strand:+ start:255 stop:548 length:294 start_codon:yes stop_codon:yes gene_type:complete